MVVEYIRILAQACTAEVLAVHAEKFAVLILKIFAASVNFSYEHAG